jgi:hypothetical protein
VRNHLVGNNGLLKNEGSFDVHKENDGIDPMKDSKKFLAESSIPIPFVLDDVLYGSCFEKL